MDEMTELVLNTKNGSESALSALLKKYEHLINSISKKYSDMCFSNTKENEDFFQESIIAFNNAITTYDIERCNITFGAYAKICIKNRLISCVRKANSKKRKVREETTDNSVISLQDTFIMREQEKKMLSISKNVLSEYEKKIFLLYLKGNKPRDIVKITGKGKRSVNNALYRIRAKLKQEIK